LITTAPNETGRVSRAGSAQGRTREETMDKTDGTISKNSAEGGEAVVAGRQKNEQQYLSRKPVAQVAGVPGE